ncbi:FadR/GntR family transcriptional regulator [Streptomyces sp. NPDC001215]
MTPYARRGVHGQTVEALARRILGGDIPEGATLDLVALQSELDVSLTALRESLKVLAAKGMVDARQKRGTFVRARADAGGEDELRRRVVGTDIEDVLRFREVLEVGAAGLCAAHGLTPEQGARLREALARTQDAPLAEYRRRDTLLHLTLAELCGSPSLTAQYAAVRATVNDLLDCIPLLVRNLEHSQRQHEALVDAVLDGDADGAREMMREHCAGTAALLRGFLA